jgi:hypothetical protein
MGENIGSISLEYFRRGGQNELVKQVWSMVLSGYSGCRAINHGNITIINYFQYTIVVINI